MKYALVTGGSRGIGRAVCISLAQMGYCVIVNYLSNDAEAGKTLELISEAGGSGELLKFDVSDMKAASDALEGWMESHTDGYILSTMPVSGRMNLCCGWNPKTGTRCLARAWMPSTMSPVLC